MVIPDLNLLVYAYDSTGPHHLRARRWWEATLSSGEPIGISWIVILGFLRIMTHPVINANPMTVAEVRERIEQWMELPQVLLLVPREGTLAHLFDLMETCSAGGNLSTDALIAAQALEHAGVVHSNDRDFGRFDGVRWVNPLVDGSGAC